MFFYYVYHFSNEKQSFLFYQNIFVSLCRILRKLTKNICMQIPISNTTSRNNEKLIFSFLGEKSKESNKYINEKSVDEISQSLNNLSREFSNIDSEEIASSIDKLNYYNCPICGAKSKVIDCNIEKVLVSSKPTNTRMIDGRVMIQEYLEIYEKVRICNKCHKKKKVTNLIISILCYAGSSVICIVKYFMNNTINKISDILVLIVLVLFVLLFSHIAKVLLMLFFNKAVYSIDMDAAHKNNAIEI